MPALFIHASTPQPLLYPLSAPSALSISQGFSDGLHLIVLDPASSQVAHVVLLRTLHNTDGDERKKTRKNKRGHTRYLGGRRAATMSCVVYCNIYWERTKLVMQSATELDVDAEKRWVGGGGGGGATFSINIQKQPVRTMPK